MQIDFISNFLKSVLRRLLFTAIFMGSLQVYCQVNLNNGLLAYYPFNGNAIDSSGNGNNPSFNNAILTTDRFGNANSAYSFDGSSSYMQIPNSSSLNAQSTLSISLWVKVNGFYQGKCSGNYLLTKGLQSSSGIYDAVFGNSPYGTLFNIDFCTSPADTNHESFYGAGVGDYNTFTPLIHSNKWYHIVIVYDTTKSYLYVNNVLAITGVGQPSFSNSYDLFFGRYDPSQLDPFWFNGVLDDIRIYNRAISSDEVSALYTEPNPIPSNDCKISNNTQLVIKSDTGNRSGYEVDNLTNLNPYLIDTTLGSVRLFAWTNNGAYYNYRSLMQYKLASIPKNAVVNSAKLYLYAKNNGTTEGVPGSPTYGTQNTVLLQKFTSPWLAATTSWYNQPNVDVASQKVLEQSSSISQDYVVDVTDFVQTWVNKPDSNFGFVMRMQTEDNPYNSMIFEAGAAADSTRNMRLEICYTVSSSLPVTLKSFNATSINSHNIQINFSTSDETNLSATIIERSYDGINFTKDEVINPKESSGINQYSFIDKTDGMSSQVFYRLKLINKDGSFKYSNVINVTGLESNESLTLEAFPNPFSNNNLKLNIYLLNDEALTIHVFDINGRMISEQNLHGSKGLSSLSIPTLTYAKAGIYSLRITCGNSVLLKKIIKIQ